MIYENDILLIKWSLLQNNYGISVNTLKSSTNRNIQGKTKLWSNTKINGLVHINYDTIPSATRKKLPSKEELIKQYFEGQRKIQQQAESMKEITRSHIPSEIIIDLKDRSWFAERLINFKIKSPNLSQQCLHDYPRISGWMRWIAVQDKTSIKQYGFTKMPELHAHVMALLNAEKLHNCKVNNERIFQRKLKPFKEWAKSNFSLHLQEEVLEGIVSKKIGNVNSRKMTTWHINQLVKIARDSRQLNPVMLHQDMTIHATDNKKTKVCVVWISKNASPVSASVRWTI